MENTVIIGGLLEDQGGESPQDVVRDFFSEKMLLDFNDQQVESAERMGKYDITSK